MYLKRIEIQGFKTFSTRTVFEFRPGVTAIVGANGSGKSNLVDAVRWVLGEQSFSALRSKRTEDLLFAGGGRRAPAGFAEVSLTIDNSDRLLPLPYGEVTLTRRATRAGENEYFINRTKVRLRDILEAIGPLGGSYTVINQGLVDSALNLSPTERRRLFEDAAEISVYESRRADAERRLRETNANVERVADLLAELEPRMRSLKRQAALARTHRDLSAELRALLERHYAALWRSARRALHEAEQVERLRESELQARRSAAAALAEELRGARDELRARRAELAALHNESSALHARAEVAQRDLAVGNERHAALLRQAEELERSRGELDLRREELERELAEADARLAADEARLAELRAAQRALEEELAGREAQRRELRQALDAAQRAELEAAAALEERQRRAEQLAQRRSRLAEDQQQQEAALAELERALAARRAALADAEQRAAAATQAAQQAAAAVEQARQELEATRGRRSRAEEEAAQKRRALADAEARLESLTRLQRSYAGTFAGVKAAMQWAESQRRAGFTLVSSILRVPPQIETAIEVALGSRLQHIVVERWEDAEQAIEALKRSGAGRATFLPLDTIRARHSPADDRGRAQRTDAGEQGDVLGVAADLVEVDERYRVVADYLLSRTLVVRDLAAARRELRRLSGGWTIVTLSGEQVSTGGAVTGGAQVKESGTLRRERELRELPQQVAELRQAFEQAAAERAELDRAAAAAERALQEAEHARRRAAQEAEARRAELESAQRDVTRAEADLALRQGRFQQIAADLAELEAQGQALAAEQAALETRRAEARAELERLRAEEQAQAEQDQEARARIEDARVAATSAESEVRAGRALRQATAQNMARLAEQIASARQRADELQRERAALDARNRDLEATHSSLLAQIDELRALIDPAEQDLAAREAALSDTEQRESALSAELLEAESAYGRAMLELQRARDRLDALWERAAADDIDIEAIAAEGQASPAADEGPPAAGEDSPQPPAPGDEDQEDLQAKIQQLKAKIARLGVVNPLALEEYEEAAQRHAFLSGQIDDLRRAAASLGALIGELDAAMRARFETTFGAVAAEFERTFAQLFGGGQAQLVLQRSDESSNGVETNGSNGAGGLHVAPKGMDGLGVEIIARPPGKRQQTLALLSGGERSLTAVALLFAILKVNPSPFCVLDEVDAALDESNVGRFREALAELAEQTQFLIVTHNRGTIEIADTIYGISMGEDGGSKVLSLRLEEIES